MREATYGVSARVIASFFVLSIALVFFVSGNLGSFKFFTGSKSEFKVPIVELQTKLTSASDEFQARSTTTNSFRNRTVIREKNGGLEHGLARARALIRTVATLSPNMSLTLPDGDGDVLTSDIYRNYGEFYQLLPLVAPPATTTATAATTTSSLATLSLFSYSLHRSSPVVSTLVVGFKTLTLPSIFSNPSTSHMFESKPYTLLNCFRTFVYKGLPPDLSER